MKRKNWHASGFKIVGRTGVIEYTLVLPVAVFAVIQRKAVGEPWAISTGMRKKYCTRKWRGRFKSAKRAMEACEHEVRALLLRSVRMLPPPEVFR